MADDPSRQGVRTMASLAASRSDAGRQTSTRQQLIATTEVVEAESCARIFAPASHASLVD
jgi:hypothetical protein